MGPVLKTETIQGIKSAVPKPNNSLLITFTSDDVFDNFCAWLGGVRGDANVSPAERYETVRVAMSDYADPSCAE